jgi:hypothetical protein
VTRWYLNETDYPATRRVMGPERETLDDEELESLLEGMFPRSEPGYIEDFMQTLQQFGRQAAPIVQKAAPGMAQGAIQGGMVAGPWGALAGALAGGATALMSGGGPTAPAPGAASPGMVPLPAAVPIPAAASAPVAGFAVPAATPAGFAPPSGTSSAATAQLLTLLAQPETMQALLSLIMAQSGRPTIPLGRREVPAPAFANAIAELAAEAAQVPSGSGNGTSGYWFDPHGAPRCDLANPTACAALLWGDLAEASEAENEEEETDTEQESEWEWGEEEEAEGDAIATFEAALAGRNSYDY